MSCSECVGPNAGTLNLHARMCTVLNTVYFKITIPFFHFDLFVFHSYPSPFSPRLSLEVSTCSIYVSHFESLQTCLPHKTAEKHTVGVPPSGDSC